MADKGSVKILPTSEFVATHAVPNQPIEHAQICHHYSLRPRLVPTPRLSVVGGGGAPEAGSRQSEIPIRPKSQSLMVEFDDHH